MQAQHSIDIQAPAERVWDILTDIDRWPQWQPAVSKARRYGTVSVGTGFTWTSGGMGIRSRIVEVAAPRVIEWTGVALGTRARHRWELIPTGQGTQVRTHETLDGWMVRVLGVFDRRFLDKALLKALSDLKAEAERLDGPRGRG